MDVEKELLLVLNNNEYKDITAECEYYKEDNYITYIKFKKGAKVYKYSKDKVKYYNAKGTIDIGDNNVYISNFVISNINKVIDFGEYVKVIYNENNTKTVKKEKFKMSKNMLKDNNIANIIKSFSYLAQILDKNNENKECDEFLSKQYRKIKDLSEHTVLATYLSGKIPKQHIDNEPLIFPFGFNTSQAEATYNAMHNEISLIEGPPGTGKTQTILNIIANIIVRGKTVAIVSSNNSAVANVNEKLDIKRKDKDGKRYIDDNERFSFIAALMGNYNNREIFFKNQENLIIPDMDNWKIEDEKEIEEIKNYLIASLEKILSMFEHKTRIARAKEEISILETQFSYFIEYYNENKENEIQKISYRNLAKINKIEFLSYYNLLPEDNTIDILKKNIKLFFKFGMYNFKTLKNNHSDVILYIQKRFYEDKINSLKKEIKNLENILELENFNSLLKEYENKSLTYFRNYLSKKYYNYKKKYITKIPTEKTLKPL